ncbi:MAG: type III toxin-antitoxin system ToxN/AbiQ family toxin [Firmicutes bacterium]|nr:type III toxin-antitoxin system ToxN/AbiQ family toxin [Bacillota bacterium]
MNLKFYEVDSTYIDYLSQFAEHLFRNARREQQNSRKYIGIILEVNGFKYFVPLSSFKPKHKKMQETTDFIKIKDYAVLNINNMLPVPDGLYEYVDINAVKDLRYKSLLQAEYREIKRKRDLILKNAKIVYTHKLKNGEKTPLARRTNDFALLEKVCGDYGNK